MAVLPLVWRTSVLSVPTCRVGTGITRSQIALSCSVRHTEICSRGVDTEGELILCGDSCLFIITQRDPSLAAFPGPVPVSGLLPSTNCCEVSAPRPSSGMPREGALPPSRRWCGAGRRLCRLAPRDLPPLTNCFLNSSPNFENTKWAGLPGKNKKWDHVCPQHQGLPVIIFRAGDSIWKNVRTVHTLEGAWEKDEAF